jgi:IS4 transposase
MSQLTKIFTPFLNKSPVCVMTRALLEHALDPRALDDLFARVADAQYTRELLFSSAVDLMTLVVCKVQPSLHAAYQDCRDDLTVSVTSVYNKLNGLETAVSEALVRHSADRLAPVLDALNAPLPPPLPGYDTRILDGNHLPATQHRIAELRTLRAGALPGQALVVFDPSAGLVRDVFCCEDGHAQERASLQRVLDSVGPGQVWVADRNFCTTGFLFGIDRRGGFFVIRQHGSTLNGKRLLGQRRRRGTTKTGVVYEQRLELDSDDGSPPLVVRRITLCLFEPTRDGDTQIHILTNLPAGGKHGVSAVHVAVVYGGRWTIETAFQAVEALLASELNTLGYPRAGLFAFCVALVAYNVLAVVQASLRRVHGVERVRDEVSGFYLANEVRRVYGGMLIAIPAEHWEAFATWTAAALAEWLQGLAGCVRLSAFRKHPRGPKKPKPKKQSGYKQKHVSTAKILAARKQAVKKRSVKSP